MSIADLSNLYSIYLHISSICLLPAVSLSMTLGAYACSLWQTDRDLPAGVVSVKTEH